MDGIRSYAIPIVFTLCVHSVVLALVVKNWSTVDLEKRSPTPNYVKAKLVKLKDSVEQKKPVAKKKTEKKELQKKSKDEKESQWEIKRRQKAAEEAKRKVIAEKKRKAELAKKKAAEAKRKVEAEKQRLAAEAKKKAEAERARHQQEVANLEKAMAEEEEYMQAQADNELASSYISYIRGLIENNWSRPPSARNGMVLVLQIQLIPTGDVVNVSIAESSGNAALDRSAVNAVKKVGRFSRLKELPSRVFERNFRTLKLKYKVEGMRL